MQNKVLILLARKEWRSGRGPLADEQPRSLKYPGCKKVNGCRTRELLSLL